MVDRHDKKQFTKALKLFAQYLVNSQQRGINNETRHDGVQCKFCFKRNFKGPRYKCLSCKDFDLCGICFEKRRKREWHVPKHVMMLVDEPPEQNLEIVVQAGLETINKIATEMRIEHENCNCDGCEKTSFAGLRFNCDDCQYLNLCFKCFSNKEEPKSHRVDHSMVCLITGLKYYVNPNEIKFERLIGEGNFGKTYLATYKKNAVACKVVDAKMFQLLEDSKVRRGSSMKDSTLSLRNEMHIYRELVSPFIVRYIGESTEFKVTDQFTDVNMKLMILLEYMNFGTLEDLIHNKSEGLSLRRKFILCLQLISGIRRIHSKGITHKDLKPDNIFIDEDLDLKIGDMGLANTKDSKHLENLKQVLYYPIVNDRVQMADDIYSFGMIMNEIFTEIKLKKFQTRKELKISKFFEEIILTCIRPNREERPIAEQIEDYLLVFDQRFWKFLQSERLRYRKSMPLKEKDEIFKFVYKEISEKFSFI